MTFQSAQAGPVERLTLDRPPVNALDWEAVEALAAHFEARPKDQPLVIRGSGKAFSAGVDVKAFAAYNARERVEFFSAITRMIKALCAIDAPVVAGLNGHAFGGGFVLALCADYRIAAAVDAQFGLTEAQAGIPFPDGALAVITAELPPPLLRHMTLSSATLFGETLRAHQVLDEIVPDQELLSRTISMAEKLAGQRAFPAVKAQIRGALRERLKTMKTN